LNTGKYQHIGFGMGIIGIGKCENMYISATLLVMALKYHMWKTLAPYAQQVVHNIQASLYSFMTTL